MLKCKQPEERSTIDLSGQNEVTRFNSLSNLIPKESKKAKLGRTVTISINHEDSQAKGFSNISPDTIKSKVAKSILSKMKGGEKGKKGTKKMLAFQDKLGSMSKVKRGIERLKSSGTLKKTSEERKEAFHKSKSLVQSESGSPNMMMKKISKSFNFKDGVKKGEPIIQGRFKRAITTAWLNEEKDKKESTEEDLTSVASMKLSNPYHFGRKKKTEVTFEIVNNPIRMMENGMEEFMFKYGQQQLKYGEDTDIKYKLVMGILGTKEGFSRKIFSRNLDEMIEEIKQTEGIDIKMLAKYPERREPVVDTESVIAEQEKAKLEEERKKAEEAIKPPSYLLATESASHKIDNSINKSQLNRFLK